MRHELTLFPMLKSYQGKPWTKVDGPGMSYEQKDYERPV